MPPLPTARAIARASLDIEDWMFTRDKETVGGFQIPILQRRQSPR